MSFLNPWLLAGAAFAALPLLIHLFDRRRLPRQALPTLRFLHAVNEQVKRRIRLRDAVLLALRMAAIITLAILIAHPFWKEREGSMAANIAAQDTIYLLDSSFGMRYRIDSKPLFDRARERVAREARALQPGQEAALMVCADKWAIVSDGFGPGDRIHSVIDKAVAGDAIANWPECLRGALALAAKSRNKAVEVRVFTNLAATGWESGDIPQAPKEKPVTLNVIDIAGEIMPNRAVTGISLARGYGNAGEQWSVTVEASNFGEPVRAVGLKVEADGGGVLAQGLFDWDAPGLRQKTLATKPPGEEFVGGNARLDPDGLADDDERPFQFYFGKPVQVLIVDGAPGTVAEESESYFPLTALRPGRTQSSVEPRVLTRTNLEPKDINGVSAVMLLNVAELGEATIALLRQFVENGGGLFWSMGDRVNPQAYGRLGALMPGRFRTLRDLRGKNDSVTLKSFPGEHPIFQEIGEANLSTASFSAYQLLEGLPPKSRVLLEFADGSPALVEAPLGRGRILWFASSLDDAWNNLPFRPFYLPLLQQSVRYLAGTLKPATQRTFPLHATVDLSTYVTGRPATLRTPDGRVLTVDPKRAGGTLVQDTATAGLYRVFIDGKPLPDANFIVTRAPKASDLTRISEDRLQASIAAAGYGGGVESAAGGKSRRLDPTIPLLVLIGAVLCGEAFFARRGDK